MEYIHAKFRNLYKLRVDWLEAEERSKSRVPPVVKSQPPAEYPARV